MGLQVAFACLRDRAARQAPAAVGFRPTLIGKSVSDARRHAENADRVHSWRDDRIGSLVVVPRTGILTSRRETTATGRFGGGLRTGSSPGTRATASHHRRPTGKISHRGSPSRTCHGRIRGLAVARCCRTGAARLVGAAVDSVDAVVPPATILRNDAAVASTVTRYQADKDAVRGDFFTWSPAMVYRVVSENSNVLQSSHLRPARQSCQISTP